MFCVGIVYGITCVLNVAMSDVAGMDLKSVWKPKKPPNQPTKQPKSFFSYSKCQMLSVQEKGKKTLTQLQELA